MNQNTIIFKLQIRCDGFRYIRTRDVSTNYKITRSFNHFTRNLSRHRKTIFTAINRDTKLNHRFRKRNRSVVH
ncbi:hypothetical protein HanIR_Chr08g0376941 [Helianthus annuus]|nr:hypothetical protein HanIR_Chr08g0376941 [Helianthus annuus]